MLHHTGVFLDQTYRQKTEHTDKVKLHILWYLMNLVRVHRYITHESLREFLIRYCLVAEKSTDDIALDYIDNSILIHGTIKDQYFSFTLQDLVDLIGFSCSDFPYNIRGSLAHFKDNYAFKAPNPKIEPIESPDGSDTPTAKITPDAFAYGLMGLDTLFEIQTLNIRFRSHIRNLGAEEVDKAIKLADYVVGQLPAGFFEQYRQDFPGVSNWARERFHPERSLKLNVYREIDRETLAKIYEIIVDKPTAECFLEYGEDDVLVDELKWYNEHIKIAIGVKNGFIKVSDSPHSLFNCIDPYFDLDIDLIMGDEGNCYPTQQIYDGIRMEEWIHLVPALDPSRDPRRMEDQNGGFSEKPL